MRQMTDPGNPPTAAADEPVHWLTKPESIRNIWIGFILILVGIAAGDLFVHHHEHFGVDGTFTFYAWYGFATCVGMVVGAKVLGIFLKRPDTYYQEEAETVESHGAVGHDVQGGGA